MTFFTSFFEILGFELSFRVLDVILQQAQITGALTIWTYLENFVCIAIARVEICSVQASHPIWVNREGFDGYSPLGSPWCIDGAARSVFCDDSLRIAHIHIVRLIYVNANESWSWLFEHSFILSVGIKLYYFTRVCYDINISCGI